MSDDKRIEKALGFAFQYGQIDGDHHKLWVIDQMVRALTGDGYEAWVKNYETGEGVDPDGPCEWDTGIAP